MCSLVLYTADTTTCGALCFCLLSGAHLLSWKSNSLARTLRCTCICVLTSGSWFCWSNNSFCGCGYCALVFIGCKFRWLRQPFGLCWHWLRFYFRYYSCNVPVNRQGRCRAMAANAHARSHAVYALSCALLLSFRLMLPPSHGNASIEIGCIFSCIFAA